MAEPPGNTIYQNTFTSGNLDEAAEVHLNPAFYNRKPPKRRSTDGLEHIMASVNLPLHTTAKSTPLHESSRISGPSVVPGRPPARRGRARTYSRSTSATYAPFTPSSLSITSIADYTTPPETTTRARQSLSDASYFFPPVPPTPLVDPSTQVDEVFTLLTATTCISTVRYHGGPVRIATTASPFHIDVWLVTVRSGGPPIWLRIPRLYHQHYSHYAIDSISKTLVIEWKVALEERSQHQKEATRTAYRVDFSEDSDTDPDSDLESWTTVTRSRKNSLGSTPLSSATEFGFMAGCERLEDYTLLAKQKAAEEKSKSKESLHYLTKEEKKTIRKSLQMTSTKEIASAVKEAKKKEREWKKDMVKTSKSYTDLTRFGAARGSISVSDRPSLTRTTTDVPNIHGSFENRQVDIKESNKPKRKPLFQRTASAAQLNHYQQETTLQEGGSYVNLEVKEKKKEGKRPLFSRRPTAIRLEVDLKESSDAIPENAEVVSDLEESLSTATLKLLFDSAGALAQDVSPLEQDQDEECLQMAALPRHDAGGLLSTSSESPEKETTPKVTFSASAAEKPSKSGRFHLPKIRSRKSSLSSQPLLQVEEETSFADESKSAGTSCNSGNMAANSSSILLPSSFSDPNALDDDAQQMDGSSVPTEQLIKEDRVSGDGDWVVLGQDETPKKKKKGFTRKVGQMRRSFSTYF
ncbi:hypothetical protein BJ508DRAFT_347271 [Ascobolus immersus RN42]|uniref:Uncharacterized protein n=1 Tax=Ascobolus immersus RN42 TaxID=1160509 RepID=A0A3N4I4D4_ASCIM|nr:hypothetical protein BJ508DRAFT_347271 [Ascobolus immersus RN42]